MRVFLSHCSADKPGVLALAEALTARGFVPWLDLWEITAGQDIVARMNQGLEQAEAAIVVFSRAAAASAWMAAEVSYLIWAQVQLGKRVIPVLVEADAPVPPLLRPLAWLALERYDEIIDALRAPRAATAPLSSDFDTVTVCLRPGADAALTVQVQLAGTLYGEAVHLQLPRALSDAWDAYRGGLTAGLLRADRPEQQVRALESALAVLGAQLGALCLPGESGVALASLLDGCPAGRWVEVVFEAGGAALLALPFEALTLPDGRPLALHPSAVTLRRPWGPVQPNSAPAVLAGPLKILVAVAAPDEHKSAAAVLDLERELQVILDAVAPARREHQGQVRFLEIGHPREIANALCSDAYHVLHLSCHGMPGLLMLEDEDGNELPTSAEALIAPLKGAHRALPLVLLNTCHGGSAPDTASSLAESLLCAGVPAVLAMTTSVSDVYATALAQAFYEALQRRQFRPGPALAAARRELEQQRQEQQARGLSSAGPEYATASLFLAGTERALLDPKLARCPLQQTPVHRVDGPVPQLGLGDLIGRRAELRRCLGLLNEPGARKLGLVLTGIGGIGKSTLAGRIMARQRERGWLLAAQVGRWDMAKLCETVAEALEDHEPAANLYAKLCAPDLDDRRRQQLLHRTVSQFALLLVLDDFEQNLDAEGQFLDPNCAEQLLDLAAHAGAARLLLTSRPFPQGCSDYFAEQALGGLSRAESGKLISRLSRLSSRDQAELTRIQNLIGGHPRLLELLDALLNDGEGRLPAVGKKLKELLQAHGQAPDTTSLDGALQSTVRLGLRDILLEHLLALATTKGDDEALFQLAVSRLAVPPTGLARMLASTKAESEGDLAAAEASLKRLARLTLLQRDESGAAQVPRWTAQGLEQLQSQRFRTCSLRAAHYRLWRLEHESHAYEDLLEALRNGLDGQDYDLAIALAEQCFAYLTDQRQTWGIAALAAEILETLPQDHGNYNAIADAEAEAHLALGQTDKALRRSQELLQRQQQRVSEQPERSDYQRDLSVSYIKMGDLYRALGRGDDAAAAFAKALAIAERLVESEPGRADYQRDLSVSYTKMGDLYQALGRGDEAAAAFAKDLAIAERLVESEPGRADYQRDLSVSYIKMGDLYRALGRGDDAAAAFAKALAIGERLAQSEPNRADYQRDLSVSYERMGDLYRALGRGDDAAAAFAKALAIRERLVESEPGRADYQRDLSVSYERMGDLYLALGRGDDAAAAFAKDLAISERLVESEPGRADYQRDLSVAYAKMGGLCADQGQRAEGKAYFLRSLRVIEELHRLEPERADFLRDMAVTLYLVASVDDEVPLTSLRRARDLLLGLKETRRLNPVDEPMLTDFQQMVAQLEQAGGVMAPEE